MHPTPNKQTFYQLRQQGAGNAGRYAVTFPAMYDLIQTKAFAVASSCALSLFVIANIYSYYQVPSGDCSHCYEEFGVPFALGVYGGGVTETNLLLFGFIADFFIAGMSSFLLGLGVSQFFRSHGKDSGSGVGTTA